MARTNRPHPRSKLFFVLRFLDDLESLHRLVSPYVSPGDYAEIRPLLNPAQARFCDHRNLIIRDQLRAEVQRRMLDENVSPVVMTSPEMQAFIAAEAERDRCLRLAFERRPPAASPLDDDWRPDRDTLSRVILGEHLVFGAGNRVTTANRMNEGIPTADDEGYGIDGDAVRNASVTFLGRRSFKDHEGMVRDAWSAMQQAICLDFVWTRLQPRLGPIEARREGAIDRLIAEGVPLNLFMDSLDAVAMPDFTHATVRELLKGRRELVMQEFRWRHRHNAPGSRSLPARSRRRSGP